MTRLIDADALKEKFGFTKSRTIMQIIDNAPTIEYSKNSLDYDYGFAEGLRRARKKGKWIDRNGNTWCSECRYDTIYLEGDRPLRTDFCPNCGADMRGDKE